MKRVSLILIVLGIGCILLSQGGCKAAAKSPAEGGPVVEAPPKTAAAAEPAPEPVKPKPAPTKAKPARGQGWDLLKTLADEVERVYDQGFLQPLGIEWSRLLDEGFTSFWL